MKQYTYDYKLGIKEGNPFENLKSGFSVDIQDYTFNVVVNNNDNNTITIESDVFGVVGMYDNVGPAQDKYVWAVGLFRYWDEYIIRENNKRALVKAFTLVKTTNCHYPYTFTLTEWSSNLLSYQKKTYRIFYDDGWYFSPSFNSPKLEDLSKVKFAFASLDTLFCFFATKYPNITL